MHFEKELKLLCDTLKRCRISASVVTPQEPIFNAIDFSISEIVSRDIPDNTSVSEFLGKIMPNTMYKYTDKFFLNYIYLNLLGRDDSLILVVGPYLNDEPTTEKLLELAEELKVPPKYQKDFESFYLNIPVLSEGALPFVLLDTFCEHIWNSPTFTIINLNNPDNQNTLSLTENTISDGFDDSLFNIKSMEVRYKFENELMNAVAFGQLHKEKLMLDSFSEKMFEKRVADPIRNAKNYSIIMNTLLRKATEQGGVHPVYIDRMSSDFARKIEQINSLNENYQLMREMFRSYCKLVRKYSMKEYSVLIQKTIMLIDSNLSTDLSLTNLAKHQNVSSAYLSSLFKKETGTTLSEYIREKRIKYAAYLLSSTHLQVQTVALHCGIMDVQYFSKIFKKIMGKTPKEFRELAKQRY